MHINRRFMLKSLGLGTAGFMLSPWNSPQLRAAPQGDGTYPNRYFVFCYFSGGWDLLLSLDPRDPGKYADANIRATKIQPAYTWLPDTLSDRTKVTKDVIQPKGSNIDYGPAMHHYAMAGHHDVTCMVRGVPMDTVTHGVGRRYFITGMMPNGLNPKGSAMPTRIVSQQSGMTPIPNLVVRVETFNEDDPAYASGLKVSSVSDLLATLQDGSGAPGKDLRALLEDYRKTRDNCDPVKLDDAGLLHLIQAAQTKSRVLVAGGLREKFDFFNTKIPEMATLKSRYGITSSTSPEAQAAMAFQAVKNNIAQCVSIELASGLDTHGQEWAENQIERQSRGFKALSRLVTDLKTTDHPGKPGEKLIDHTTIVCFSEFGRTALINNRDGRDHSICNAAMLIGAGVPHNKVVGASSDIGMNPEAIDPVTGLPERSGGTLVRPDLIMASIMESAGYDTEKLRVRGLPALMRKS
jgi:hypothetical protein